MLNQIQQESESSAPSPIAQYELGPPLEVPPTAPAQPNVLTQDEMGALQKQLVSKNKSISGPAEQQLAQMDSTALTAFLAFERQSRARKIKCTVIGLVAAYGILAIVSLATHQSSMFSMFGSLTGVMAGAAAFSTSYKSGVIALTRLENSDSIGELISALEIQDKEVQQVVRPALIRMLPKLRSSDAKLLNDANRQTLRKILQGKLAERSSRRVSRPVAMPLAMPGVWYSFRQPRGSSSQVDTQLRVAILKALCQVGDISFEEIVKSLAEDSWNRVSGTAPEIQAAARECLPNLRQRSQDAVASSELVRPSSANNVGSADTLLRPLAAVQEMHETQLLRAADE